MSYEELNREQILALKQNYLQGNVSYKELAEADNLVSDEELEQELRTIEDNISYLENLRLEYFKKLAKLTGKKCGNNI